MTATGAAAVTRVAIGIGCRAGSTDRQIEAAVQAALERCAKAAGVNPIVSVVATLDAKAGEPGLVACCARRAWPLAGFTPAQLAALPACVTGSAPSAAVRARFGVDGICEPCARLAAPQGKLLVAKLHLDGVTVAVAGPVSATLPPRSLSTPNRIARHENGSGIAPTHDRTPPRRP